MALVGTIYSTLGLVRSLAWALREQGLLEGLFMAGFLLVVAAITSEGLRRRPSGREVWVALGVIAVYVLMFLRMSIPEERTHLIEYGVVAVFIYEALTERVSHGRRVPAPAALAIIATGLLGAIDEGIQAVLPNRVFHPGDILVNVLAGLVAVGAGVTLGRARRRIPPPGRREDNGT